MKNLDKLSQRILAVGVGTSAIILSAALLMSSVGYSYGGDNSNSQQSLGEMGLSNLELSQSGGKYRCQYVFDRAGDKYVWHVMVNNVETGKFKIYNWDKSEQKWKEYFATYALPSLP